MLIRFQTDESWEIASWLGRQTAFNNMSLAECSILVSQMIDSRFMFEALIYPASEHFNLDIIFIPKFIEMYEDAVERLKTFESEPLSPKDASILWFVYFNGVLNVSKK